MKNTRNLILLIVCSIGFGSVGLFIGYQCWTFDKRRIFEYTGIDKDYQLIQAVNDHHQWYVSLKIKKDEAKNILKRYDFKNGVLDLRGVLSNNYIQFTPNGWYYIDKATHGAYGYLIIYLNDDLTQLKMYELFND